MPLSSSGRSTLVSDLFVDDEEDPNFAPEEYLREEQEYLRPVPPSRISDRIAYFTFADAIEVHRTKWGDNRTDLFVEALDTEKSDLLAAITRDLFQPDQHYIYLAPAHGRQLNNYEPLYSEQVAREEARIEDFGLFANPLGHCPIGLPAQASPPSARPINAGFSVLTIEFDTLSLGRQLYLAQRISTVDRRLCEARDYRGYCVVYGGNKSFHFHFLFDLSHLRYVPHAQRHGKFTGEIPDGYLPALHGLVWDRLSEIFLEETRANDAKPDTALRSMFQPRRLPLGHRRVGANHPLGLREGAFVKQVVLAERILKKASDGAKAWFHDPALLTRCRDEIQAQQSVSRSDAAGQPCPPLMAHADYVRVARAIEAGFTEGQRAAGMSVAAVNRHGARIRNSSRDRNPGSVIRDDFRTVRAAGTDAAIASPRSRHRGRAALHDNGVSFHEQAVTSAQMRRLLSRDDSSARRSDESHEEGAAHALNKEFQIRVTHPSHVRAFLNERIVEPLSLPGITAILTAEGAGKTRATMTKIETVIENAPLSSVYGGVAGFDEIGTKEWVIFACPEYQQIRQKIAEFREIWGDEIIAFECPSVTRLYEGAIAELRERSHNVKPVSEEQALESGSSWLRYVCEQQPEVWRIMRRTPERLWKAIRAGKRLILFMVHEVARRHILGGVTRLFYSPGLEQDFFALHGVERAIDLKRRQRLTTAAQVIFDEISVFDLVAIRPRAHVEWAWRFLDYADAQARSRNKCFAEMPRQEQYVIAKHFVACDPKPEDLKGWWWQGLRDLIAIPFDESDLVTIEKTEAIKTGGRQDGGDIYQQTVGRQSYVREAPWLSPLHDTSGFVVDRGDEKITILTTELLAGLTIEKLRGRGYATQTLWFDDPVRLRQDHCGIVRRKDCRKQNAAKIVDQLRTALPRVKIIADTIHDPFEATTHAGARGSNRWSKQSLIAIFLFLAPAHFADLTAIGQWLGIEVPVALFYVDRFNQSVGRNRGFRSNSETKTFAVMSPTLAKWILPYLRDSGRYHTPIVDETFE